MLSGFHPVALDAAAPGIPTPDHVVIVIDENRAYDEIIGSAAAPYVNSLAADANGAVFTDYFALEHPSQPNYLELFSGSNQGVTDDSVPSGAPFSTANLGSELLADGKPFIGYAEDLPSVGFTGAASGEYARKHCPWVNWQGTGTNQIPAADSQPLTAFPSDFSKLPTVSFVIPNLNDDMHDGTIQAGDAWLQQHLDGYIQWAKTHNSLLLFTFDEDDYTENNQIPTLAVGSMVRHGQYGGYLDHYNLLRTLEDMYGLPYAGQSASAAPIIDAWNITLNLSGASFSFTGGPAPANWTILVDGSPVTNIQATITAVSFTGTGGSATANIVGASPSGESADISPSQATFNGVGSSGPYMVTATNLLSATVTSGGSGSLSVTDAAGGNVLTESPASTTLVSSSNPAAQEVAKGFNNVIATAAGAGSSTVASLFGSSAADAFTANPQSAVMQDSAATAYRLEADGFASMRGIGGTGGDTALLTDAAGGVFNATGSMATLSGAGYSIMASHFASVQAVAVGPSDAAYLRPGPGNNLFSGSKGKSELKGVSFDNVAEGFFTVYAYGAATGYNTAVLIDVTGKATATLNPQTALLTDASAQSPASYQIDLPSGFQAIQAIETSLVGSDKAILKGSSTAANSFTSTSTTATLVPAAGNAFREYARGFATVQAASTYATDTASLFDSPGNDLFTATPTAATMSLATGTTVTVGGFKTVNAYSRYGGTDTANLTGSTGTDAAWLWNTNVLLKTSAGNTVRAWCFADYNLDGGGGSGDTATTLDASVLPVKQTTVAGAKVIAWLTDFARMNQDYSPGSQYTNQSYAIALDQVLTAYWD